VWRAIHGFRVVAVELLLHLCDGQASQHIGPAVIGSVLIARLESPRHAVNMDAQSEGDSHAFHTVNGDFCQRFGDGDGSSSK
jgi:hypothetical protein